MGAALAIRAPCVKAPFAVLVQNDGQSGLLFWTQRPQRHGQRFAFRRDNCRKGRPALFVETGHAHLTLVGAHQINLGRSAFVGRRDRQFTNTGERWEGLGLRE